MHDVTGLAIAWKGLAHFESRTSATVQDSASLVQTGNAINTSCKVWRGLVTDALMGQHGQMRAQPSS